MPTTTYTPLATITLTSTDSEVVFSNIPNTYRDLILVSTTRNSSQSAPFNQYRIRVNSDGGANYSVVRMLGDSNGPGSASESGSTEYTIYFSEPSSASSFAVTISQFIDYAQTNKNKVILTRNDAPSQGITGAYVARWGSNTAINSISIFPPPGFGAWAIGSTFSLYGVIA
jgi:hypothetical protein